MMKKRIVSFFMPFCLCFVFFEPVRAESFTLSLPRIEATYFEELFSHDGEPIISSYHYHNSQWMILPKGALPERITVDTLAMAEEKLDFPMVRPTYLPEKSELVSASLLRGSDETGNYDAVRLHFEQDLRPNPITLWINQDYVGAEASLEIKTTDLLDQLEYEGQVYLCIISTHEFYVSVNLHWLKDYFAFRVQISGVPNIDESRAILNHQYLEEALRVAASLTFAND